jgi:cyclophilin family peptidyl-prolyl cis-trans isomerase
MPPAEWDLARAVPLDADGTVLRLMQVDGTLLVGFSSPLDWPLGAHLWLLFAPEGGEDRGMDSFGAVHVDYEPHEHNRPHLLVYRRGPHANEVVEGEAAARSALDAGTQAELAIRLPLLGLNRNDTAPRRFAAVWFRDKARPARTWPDGLVTRAEGDSPPVDLTSWSRWGLLEGFQEVEGPGAMSATDWARLRLEDQEITRRGRAAHSVAMEISEEPSLFKADALQVPELIGNLRWIAEREPLTPDDLLVLAKGYRFLNQKPAALATLDALATHRDWRGSERVLYEQALTLESMEDYPAAAEVWARLARSVGPSSATRYEQRVEVMAIRQEAWKAEQEARAAARQDPSLPVVRLATNRGDVLVQLFANDVPGAVRHFLDLARREEGGRGFYAGTLFHRVIGDFMAQGGDPESREAGCEIPGASLGPDPVAVESNGRHGFFRGAVAFARGLRQENGCQFFVLTSPRPAFDPDHYTVFGHVVAGMDVVDRLERCDRLEAVTVVVGGE